MSFFEDEKKDTGSTREPAAPGPADVSGGSAAPETPQAPSYVSPPLYRPTPAQAAAPRRPAYMVNPYPPSGQIPAPPPRPPHKKPRTGLIIFFSILGFLVIASLFSLAVRGIWGSNLGSLISSRVNLWADRGGVQAGDNPIKPEGPAQGSIADGSDAGDETGRPSIDIVTIPEAKIEKKVDSSGRAVLEIPQIAELASPSVVGIITRSTDDVQSSTIGSGVIFTEDGYIITNAHVLEGSDNVRVILEDQTEYTATVIGSDSKADIAVVKIDATGLPKAEFGDSDALRVGDLAVAIGNPSSLDLQGTTTSGIISAVNRKIVVDESGRTLTLIQTDAAINPGNSGGPLLNKYGQVIGLNTVRLNADTYEGLSFAIPSNVFKPIVDELVSYGYVKGYPSIGITGATVTETMAEVNRIPMGVIIASVAEGSDAASKGLRAYDIITKVNGKDVRSVAEINTIKSGFKVGDALTLTVYRDGDYFDVSVTLVDESDLSE